jgi:hypothetical protein
MTTMTDVAHRFIDLSIDAGFTLGNAEGSGRTQATSIDSGHRDKDIPDGLEPTPSNVRNP